MSGVAQVAPVRGFISYRRIDNEDFGGVVDRLASDVRAMYAAKTGGDLELFVDRESIGWGEDWREAIRTSVEQATVFLPVITQRYFQSIKCCEELQAFYQNADILGVTDLLLPVVLIGASSLSADDPREEVRIIERLHYESIEAAWLAGYDSPEWRRTIGRLADRLIEALGRAQGHLESVEGARVDDEPTAETDVVDMMESLSRIQPKLQAALDSSQRFADASSKAFSQNLAGLPPERMRPQLLRIANTLRTPSLDLERSATDAYREVSRFDAMLRGMLAALSGTAIRTQLTEPLAKLGDPASFEGSLTTMREAATVMRTLGALSVSIRRSVAPAVTGINAFVQTLETVRNWAGLIEPGP